MADAVVHHLSLAADIAGAPLPDMVDAEAGTFQVTFILCRIYAGALYLEIFNHLNSPHIG